MKIDNTRATKLTKLWLIRIPLLIFLVLLVLTVMEVIPTAIWLIISGGIFICTLLLILIFRLNYFKISFTKDDITVRYFHIFPLLSDYQEIMISRSDDPEFELRYSFFGKIPLLHISLQTSQGRAKYPAIPLSLLSRKDLEILKEELQIKKMKNIPGIFSI